MDKTDRTLHERNKEPAYTSGNKKEQSAMHEHLYLSRYYYSHMIIILRIHPKLTPVILVATGSTYRK